MGPSCCQDNDISGRLIQRELCYPWNPRAEVCTALQEDPGPCSLFASLSATHIFCLMAPDGCSHSCHHICIPAAERRDKTLLRSHLHKLLLFPLTRMSLQGPLRNQISTPGSHTTHLIHGPVNKKERENSY